MEYTIKDLEVWNQIIENNAKASGLDFYNQEFEIVSYKDMLAYEAYLGMPSRYPHWSFGKAYEKNKTLYRYNLTGLPYEMVINSNPCIAYLMKENTLLLQILTMSHVYGHNDFFKNNRLFKYGTDANYTLEMFKNHSNLIRGYIDDPSIGYDNVEKILNSAHALKLQTSRVIGEKRVDAEVLKQNILDDYNKKNQNVDIFKPRTPYKPPDVSKIPLEPEDDLLYFIIHYGDLSEWEKNILDIVRNEALYFIPQIETKIMNEGWASYWHYNLVNQLDLNSSLQLEFIKRHNDVIAPIPGGLNPYYLGFKMFEDINKKYGIQKLFEVRELERDESFIRRYLTQELCSELNLFEYIKKGSEYEIEEISDEEGWINIRNELCNSVGMGMVPLIRVKDMSKIDKTLILEHVFDGRELNMEYTEGTLKCISDLWGHIVILETTISGKNTKYICDCNKKVVRI